MTTRRTEKRNQKRSAARRRAEGHSSGYETTILRMPDGVGFWAMSAGTHQIDIVPFKVGKGNPWADEGEIHFERTFWSYRRIGIEEKTYVAPSKTFGHRDYVQEYRQKESKNPDVDPDALKQLAPKERQIFLIYDHKEPEKGVQIWENSFHTFGKLLDSRIKNSTEESGWDLFYFPDEDGMTLQLTIEEVSAGGYKFLEVTAIDFFPRREPLPEKIVNHGICPDELLIELSYEKLKSIFLGGTEEQKDTPGDAESLQDGLDSPNGQRQSEPVKPMPTADSYGITRVDEVMYNGKLCTVFKISGDGTSLTLVDEDDEVHKAVGPDEVVKTEATISSKIQDKPVDEPTESGNILGDGDNWEEDWDK